MRYLGVFFLVSIIACSSSEDARNGSSGAGTGAAPACTPGVQSACACAGSGEGVQVCLADGSAFGECTGCGGSGGDGGASSASGNGGATSSSSSGAGGDACVPEMGPCGPIQCGADAGACDGCGIVTDSCGNEAKCGLGICEENAGFENTTCACQPKQCVPTAANVCGAKNCGDVQLACGMSDSCGSCMDNEVCTDEQKCCAPSKTACEPGDCGTFDDGCDGIVDCGNVCAATPPLACGDGGPGQGGSCACAEMPQAGMCSAPFGTCATGTEVAKWCGDGGFNLNVPDGCKPQVNDISICQHKVWCCP